MDVHENAPLTPKGREQMVRPVVEGRMTKAAAARRFNTTSKTAVRRAAVKLALDGRADEGALRDAARGGLPLEPVVELGIDDDLDPPHPRHGYTLYVTSV